MTKRYRSRLETVVRVRRIHERAARADLARAATALRAAESEAGSRLEHHRATMAAAPASAPVDPLVAHHELATLTGQAASQAAVAEGSARSRFDEARTRYLDANARVRVLENLEERRRAEHAAAAAREESAQTDDLVTARYVMEHSL